jgi:tetratricopeptide (TPR) repeat protein
MDGDGDGDGAPADDGEDGEGLVDGNMQLAWEALEVARVIFAAAGPGRTDELAQVYMKLGEHGQMREDYKQALEDLHESLRLRETIAQPNDRELAEIRYLLGLCYMHDKQYKGVPQRAASTVHWARGVNRRCSRRGCFAPPHRGADHVPAGPRHPQGQRPGASRVCCQSWPMPMPMPRPHGPYDACGMHRVAGDLAEVIADLAEKIDECRELEQEKARAEQDTKAMLLGAMHDAMASFGQGAGAQNPFAAANAGPATNPFAAANAGAAANPFAAANAGAASAPTAGSAPVARDLGSLVRKRKAPANEDEADDKREKAETSEHEPMKPADA